MKHIVQFPHFFVLSGKSNRLSAINTEHDNQKGQ